MTATVLDGAVAVMVIRWRRLLGWVSVGVPIGL